jgi:colicin import membrane protein
MSTIVTEVTALAVIETMTPAKLFEPGTIDPLIERIKTEVRSVAIDTSTGSGRKACASLAFKVARSKTFIDKQRSGVGARRKETPRRDRQRRHAHLERVGGLAKGSSQASD